MLRSCGVLKAPMSARSLRHHEAAELGEVGRERQLVDRFGAAVLLQRRQRLLGQLLEILMARRDADVVEAVVGAERVRRLNGWQLTQRALPLNSTQPACASGEMASGLPARKRSNGESRKTSVRSNAAMARPTSS